MPAPPESTPKKKRRPMPAIASVRTASTWTLKRACATLSACNLPSRSPWRTDDERDCDTLVYRLFRPSLGEGAAALVGASCQERRDTAATGRAGMHPAARRLIHHNDDVERDGVV